MSVGPLGFFGVAGTPLSQTKGSEAERTAHDVDNQQRQTRTDGKAEQAAGIGETDGEDHETAERDADGRRLWEAPVKGKGEKAAHSQDEAPEAPRVKDVHGEAGNHLDLMG